MNVSYIDHMGSDLTVVNAARVSFNTQHLTWEEKDKKLLSYLAENDHWTPFAHIIVQMRIEVPIAIARQMFKHQVGFVYNEVSGRYTTKDIEFFLPSELRNQKGKQGSEGVHEHSAEYLDFMEYAYDFALSVYERMIKDGVAIEQARFVLPQGEMTKFYATGSVAAWARMYHLRTGEHAQKEWALITPQIDAIIRPLFPNAWSALVD